MAILGFGRFGRAVAERMIERGGKVRAWDPAVNPPDEIAAQSAADAVAGTKTVLLAIPVSSTESILTEVRPHLSTNQVVIEAGSVKSGPTAAMEAILGKDIPWAATHPLFGPVSLSLGERPLRTVVCPNAFHPAAVKHAEEFWRSLGCEILHMDPEEHDRSMAHTHALAFFIAKGFLDCGFDLDTKWAPPSVAGMARTVRSARADAGQLYATLHRENPWAGDARAQLMDVLTRADEALRAPPEPGEQAHQEDERLRLAELPEPPPQLREVRDLIDEVDQELVRLLAQRAELALRASRAKADVGRGVRDPKREEEVLEARRALAESLDLDPDAVSEIFRAVINLALVHQAKHSP